MHARAFPFEFFCFPILKGAQQHWSVENSLNQFLNVTMNEDHLRNRTGPGPENLAVMRRLALNLARVTEKEQTKSMSGRLKKPGWDHRYALKLISSGNVPLDVETRRSDAACRLSTRLP